MPTIVHSGFDVGHFIGSSTNVNQDTMPENGWITSFTYWVRADASGQTIEHRSVLYLGNDRVHLGAKANQGYNGGTHVEKTANVELRAESGKTIRWGPWVGPISGSDASLLMDFDAPTGVQRQFNLGGTPPATWSPDGTFNEALKGVLTYVANVAPLTPTWRSPANNATVNNPPTVQGNLLQAAADDAYDTIDQYDFQLWNSATGAMILNTTYNTTSTERNQGYFSRSISGLTAGTSYTMRFRTIDSWGSKSADWSNERSFAITAASDAPVLTSPINNEKLNVLSGYNYVFQHSHPQNLNANAYQILVKNNAGTTLYDSGTVVLSPTVANGGTITVPEFHADLTYNTTYKWQARTRDTANNFGPYAGLETFHTNQPPNAPTGLSPANNVSTGTPTFTAVATDPDGDPISTAQIEIALVSTGATVAGYPASMVVGSGGALTYTAPGSGTGSLTLGTAYKWRAHANDGLGAGYGAWSEYAYFTYAALPTVNFVAPRSGRGNSVLQPSAEYNPTDLSAFWTTTTGGGAQSVTRVQEDSSPFGAYQWQGVVDGSGTLIFESAFISVTASAAQIASVFARTLSGSPLVTFSVLAYSASDVLLGTITPSSYAGLSAATPAAAWTRYGGVITQIGSSVSPAYPATTTKIKVRISATGTGTFAFDAFSHGHFAFNPTTTTERDRAQEWFGFADGDQVSFRGEDDDYTWVGTPGDSVSRMLPILTAPTGQNVVINYSHTVAKGNDRLIIQKWVRGEWVDAYDSNPTWSVSNGARTLIPLPTNIIENEGTFQLKVQVRDTSAIQGETDWVPFDVYYVGPAQLSITIAQAEPWAARTRLGWESTALGLVFAGVEVQRIDPSGEEDPQIIGVLTNVTDTEFVDHYPRSGKDYTYRIRQREQVGNNQTFSFWSSIRVRCDYSPYVFLKDTRDPTLFTAYDTAAENLVGYEEDAPVGIISPWGASRPTVLTRSKLRVRTGEVNGAFFTDAGIEIPGFLDRDTLYQRAATILKRRNTICILTTQPDPAKLFAAIVGPARVTYPYPPNVKGIEFSWQEVSYSEDVYEQDGIT